MKKIIIAVLLIAGLAAPVANAATPAAKITKPKAATAEGTAGHEMSESSNTQSKEAVKTAPMKTTKKASVKKAAVKAKK
jgi:hypothetical protein